MNRFLLILRSNWISWSGAILTTLSFMAFVTTFIYLALHGSAHGPYVGLLAFIGLPMLFLLGISAIPVGLLLYRKQLPQRLDALANKPIKLFRLLALLTVINLATVGTGGYEAVQYMDSQQFCGKVCHTVMSPAYATYLDSPHSKVACVECHIGSGAASFFRAKISGMRQLVSLAFNTYQRPIPTPVHNLRPASETCEHCHWAGKFAGDQLLVRQHFAEDEAVSPVTNVLMLKVGGVLPDGTANGIHWHASPTTKITFVSTDTKRQKVAWVRYVDGKGKEHIYTGGDLDPKAAPPAGDTRAMDCIDCHNQPSHHQQEADAALDAAIASGAISRQLPSIRKIGLETLKQSWSRDTAKDAIAQELQKVYAGNATLSAEAKQLIAPASAALADIWLRNIYPEMGITWGAYPTMAGHVGCFRCHDGEHMDAEGVAITNDCVACHASLAKQEADPQILKQIGYRDH